MTCSFLSLSNKPVLGEITQKNWYWVDLAHAADSQSACVRLEMQKCNVSVLVRPLFSCKCSISDHHSSSEKNREFYGSSSAAYGRLARDSFFCLCQSKTFLVMPCMQASKKCIVKPLEERGEKNSLKCFFFSPCVPTLQAL